MEDLLVTFAVKGRPVGHAPVQEPNMYEIKMVFLVDPLAAAVVNFETKIGRGEVRLNGREVGRWKRGSVFFIGSRNMESKNYPLSQLREIGLQNP